MSTLQHKPLRLLASLLIGLMVSSSTIFAQSSPTSLQLAGQQVAQLVPAAQSALIDYLENWTGLPSGTDTVNVLSVRQESDWALMTVSFSGREEDSKNSTSDENKSFDPMQLYWMVASSKSGLWRVAIEKDEAAEALIAETGLSDEAKQAFVRSMIRETNNTQAVASQAYNNYKFPWRSGTK